VGRPKAIYLLISRLRFSPCAFHCSRVVTSYKQVCTNVVQMGGDVGALLSAPGWLFIGLPNEVQVIGLVLLS
jgi:hypothetical protein